MGSEAQMAGQPAAIRHEPGGRPKRSPEATRLLRAILTPTLLGERVPMDFYARGGFRLLAVPAWIDSETLAIRCQQFRNRVRLNAAHARHEAIQTISDEHLDTEALSSAVAK